ncbi:MAG: hypothetical protein R2774_03735 [Saprospiraceae bacterium]
MYLRAGFQALAHGTVGCAMSELRGGKFIHGFASSIITGGDSQYHVPLYLLFHSIFSFPESINA